jgi:hypothetical protein
MDGSGGAVRARVTLRLRRDEPGLLGAEVALDVPTTVDWVRVAVAPGVDVERVGGLERVGGDGGGGALVWDRRRHAAGTPPRFELAVRDGTPSGPGVDRPYVVDRGEYAVVELAGAWRILGGSGEGSGSDGSPAVVDGTVDVEVAGEGCASDDGNLVYLGPHDVETGTAAGERIEVVVPAAATPTADPVAIRDTLQAVSRKFRVGGRSDRVFALVLPVAADAFAPVGRHNNGASFWVRADRPLADPATTWLHEYVHTRQAFAAGREGTIDWLPDATADYYGGLFAVRTDNATRAAFRSYLAPTDRRTDYLLRRGRWRDERTPYEYGRRVVAALDAELRRRTDDRRTFTDVLAALNERPGGVGHGDLKAVIRDVGGEPLAALLDEYVVGNGEPHVTAADVERVLDRA